MGAFFSLSKSASLTALDVSEWALLVFGILLVIGLIIEYRAEHGSRWMKFGELLVIIGVAGELLGDGGIFLFSRHLQAIADHEIIELTKEAGTAKDSAKTAHEEADTVKKETDELTTRLGDAAKQLGLVEQDIRIQGPRSKLLIAAAPRLVKQLKLFAGQRVRLVVCGTQGSQDQETLDTWGAIANILGSDTVGGVTGLNGKKFLQISTFQIDVARAKD